MSSDIVYARKIKKPKRETGKKTETTNDEIMYFDAPNQNANPTRKISVK